MKPPKTDIPPTIENVEKAYKIAAKLVARYGEAYLPIFERMHSELQNAKKQKDLKNLALQAALD